MKDIIYLFIYSFISLFLKALNISEMVRDRVFVPTWVLYNITYDLPKNYKIIDLR